jgi:hypothetical protein
MNFDENAPKQTLHPFIVDDPNLLEISPFDKFQQGTDDQNEFFELKFLSSKFYRELCVMLFKVIEMQNGKDSPVLEELVKVIDWNII